MRLVPLLFFTLLVACPPPKIPVIASFTATPADIAPGETTQLDWSATGVDGCTLSPSPGKVAPSGSLAVSPDVTTAWTLSCGNAVAHVRVSVQVPQPPVQVQSFTASPAAIIPDARVTLQWSVANSIGCQLDHGVGGVPVTGALELQPTDSTTWLLTCQGVGGPVNATAAVAVTPATTLEVPTGVTVTPGDGLLTIAWAPAPGAADVYVAEVTGLTQANVDTLPGGRVVTKVVSPFALTGLVNGRTYFVRVSAASGTLESALAPELSGVPADGASWPDPYYSAQWHLKNTGQAGGRVDEDIRAEGAWASGRGEGVRLAIVDEGVDLDHEDLRANVVQQQSFDYLGHAALKLAQHGTCVAGLAAARDLNGIGVRGVAPRASLVSYNILQNWTSANAYDAMTRGDQLDAASNNSWGDSDGTGLLTRPDVMWLRGVAEGTRLGRGGKGTVYLWAAGNGRSSRYRDNANYDSQANSRYVFAVGAVTDQGMQTSYSEDGAVVLVAAPGGDTHLLTTTDITGALGYNSGASSDEHPDPNYSQKFNGTSAATPQVTGAVALILQARPELSWRDVRRVLALSARKNDPSDADWALNGAGLHVNHKYGFGMVDAAAAVQLARTFVTGAPEVTWSSPLASPVLAIPDNSPAGATSVIQVASSGIGHLEFVEAVITVSHTYSGNLEITLEKQGGATDVLHQTHRCSPDMITGTETCTDLTGFTFGSVRHLDEPGDGPWTLRVKDLVSGDTGALQSWKLNLYGRP